jgi:MFS family permease
MTSSVASIAGDALTRPAGTPRQRLLAPLRVPAYRFLWAGRTVSMVGDAFQLVVLPAIVLDLTQRPSGLGAVLMAQAIPRALLLLVGGVVTDRFRARSVMLVSNVLLALIVAALLVPATAGTLELWHLYVYAVAFGAVTAFFLPASTSVLAELLPEEQVRAGNALAMMTANLVRFLVPPVAAIVIVAAGEATAFAVNALSFVLAALLFGGMRTPMPASVGVPGSAAQRDMPAGAGKQEKNGALHQLLEGIRLARRDTTVWVTIQLSTVFWFGYAGAVFVGLPALAKLALDAGDQGVGIFFGASGAGALLGALASGSRTTIRRPGVVACLSIAAAGASLMLAGLAPTMWTVVPWLVAAGAFGSACAVIFLSLVQTRAPAAARGRIMSLMTLGVFGFAPLAYAAAGAVGDVLGPRGLLAGAGLLVLVCGAAGLGRKEMRELA